MKTKLFTPFSLHFSLIGMLVFFLAKISLPDYSSSPQAKNQITQPAVPAKATAKSAASAMSMANCYARLYNLNGTLSDDCEETNLVSFGGTLGANNYTFGAGQGLRLSNVLTTGTYTIEMSFSLSQISSYRRLIDFKNQNTDSGLYFLNGDLNFYSGLGSANSNVTANQNVTLLISRDDVTDEVVVYLDGNEAFSFIDTNGDAVFSGPNNIAAFFIDDGSENAAGIVDYIKIADCVYTPAAFEDLPTCTLIEDPGFCGCYNINVALDTNCQFKLRRNHVSDGTCPGAYVRVMDNDPSNLDTIDCPGVWTYGLFNANGTIICWGKVTAEDKTAPVLLCAPADLTLDCYDVNYVLNNRNTIGNYLSTATPRPSPTSSQTFNNAEGVPGTGGDNCQLGLVPPGLISDNVRNLGYAYFRDNCRDCGCRVTLKWADKVVFYSCEQTRTNGGYYAKIEREWVATDCNGMRSSYVQDLFFTRPDLDDFVFNGPGDGGSMTG